MIINQKVIYFELQKTGCTHTRNILLGLPNNDFEAFGKHNTYNQLPENLKKTFNQFFKVGNIRNPWDWYVSLWAYGCMNRGGFKSRLKLHSKNWRPWQKTYKTPDDKKAFNQWLNYVLIEKRSDVKEFGKNAFTDQFGLLSLRYLKLYTKNFKEHKKSITNLSEIEAYDKAENFIDCILRNESLSDDLLLNANDLGIDATDYKTWVSNQPNKTNSSKRKQYQFYYTPKSKKLIAEKESFLISKYKYQF